MRYDLYYIKHMSIWMDLRILVKTGAVFIRSLAPSSENEGITVPKPIFGAGPTRLYLRSRVRETAATPPVAEDAHYRRPTPRS